jgi:hypothetical protein
MPSLSIHFVDLTVSSSLHRCFYVFDEILGLSKESTYRFVSQGVSFPCHASCTSVSVSICDLLCDRRCDKVVNSSLQSIVVPFDASL